MENTFLLTSSKEKRGNRLLLFEGKKIGVTFPSSRRKMSP